MYIKNSSNTGVVLWGGRLLTMFEASQPYGLDPRTLRTLGLELLGGALSAGLPFDLNAGPRADQLLSRLQRLLGSNYRLPREYTQPGGDAFTAHPLVGEEAAARPGPAGAAAGVQLGGGGGGNV